MSGLKLRGVKKSFGVANVIKGIDLDIEPSSFACPRKDYVADFWHISILDFSRLAFYDTKLLRTPDFSKVGGHLSATNARAPITPHLKTIHRPLIAPYFNN